MMRRSEIGEALVQKHRLQTTNGTSEIIKQASGSAQAADTNCEIFDLHIRWLIFWRIANVISSIVAVIGTALFPRRSWILSIVGASTLRKSPRRSWMILSRHQRYHVTISIRKAGACEPFQRRDGIEITARLQWFFRVL